MTGFPICYVLEIWEFRSGAGRGAGSIAAEVDLRRGTIKDARKILETMKIE
jgi:hypothetical protein